MGKERRLIALLFKKQREVMLSWIQVFQHIFIVLNEMAVKKGQDFSMDY